jgi:hypothetical protein
MILISRASDAVAKTGNTRLSHLTPRGRKEFFAPHMDIFRGAWGGDDPVQPDAFLTGEAVLAPNLRTVQIKVQAFDRKNVADLKTVCEFEAAMDDRTLTEAGVSFARARGVQDDEEPKSLAQADKYPPPDEETPDDSKRFDDVVKNVPVQLKVLYNGEEVPVRAGAVREPTENDKVTFVLKNKGTETFGVVLKVDGRNTLYPSEEGPPLDCYKWILKPEAEVLIDGFQISETENKKFEVKSPEESKRDEVRYGEHAGTFTLVVFRAQRQSDDAVVKAEESRPQANKVISRGAAVPGVRPAELKSLKGELENDARSAAAKRGSRGMIGAGEKGSSNIVNVPFKPYPREVASVTIRYYQPGKK